MRQQAVRLICLVNQAEAEGTIPKGSSERVQHGLFININHVKKLSAMPKEGDVCIMNSGLHHNTEVGLGRLLPATSLARVVHPHFLSCMASYDVVSDNCQACHPSMMNHCVLT